MNLRVPDAPALVEILHRLVEAHGSIVMSLEGWRVSELEGSLLYHRGEPLEVGGPYPTMGALVRDAGHRRHAVWTDTEPKELVWDVVAWGGAFFTVRTADLANPTRHGTLDAAVAAGGMRPGTLAV